MSVTSNKGRFNFAKLFISICTCIIVALGGGTAYFVLSEKTEGGLYKIN